ncbi:DEAD/DEAH box helicase family protein [Streptomyces sp. 2.9]|uniref:DEAD/DEAH box helicase family protein n=1 Tax=Streptomyces tritrimontium TaxID=3406573 RepID=UPI003BB632FE
MSITPVAPAPEPPESQSRLGPIGRARASVEAIEILLRLREDQVEPTEGELRALREWPGWGPLAPALAPSREGTWAEIGEQLQRLLSPREYRHAEQGTPTAYYTPDRITEACWSALQGLGFNGGRILEPGCGAGTFIRHTPDGLPVDWFGVERDPTTAGIAALLHPGAEIINARLQDASLQSNSVDAVLGNVPYGNYAVSDETAPKAVKASIHNYFIWRSVQALRPGGVAILLTSRYTMDASDDTARRAIGKHADLLGAIRLPNGALAEGGTGVLADILVVRRRDTDEPVDESWMGTSAVPGVGDQQCNDYFLANPSHVLGAWEQGRAAQYGHTLAVKAPEDQDLSAVLGEAFADITTKAHAAGREWKVAAGAQPWTADNLPFPVREDGRKEGSFHLVEGKPHEVIEGELVVVPRAGKELPKLIRLRDATVALIEAETNHDTPDEQLEPLRAEVNRLYDLYVRVHGPINRFTIAQGEVDEETGEAAVSRRYPRLGGFRRDPDFVAVLALEDFDDETQTAAKAALQTRRVNKRIERPTSAETPEEALSLCLNFRNQVDVPYIAQLLSIEPGQVAEALGDLVFIEPDTEDLLTVGEYLSGPVVDKLERVEFLLSQGREDLQRHADALREVQPEPLQPEDIKARLGAPWIPVEDVTAFAEELLGVDVDITHVAKTATWSVDTPMTIPEAAISEWGTNRVNAFELLDLALNGQSPKVYDAVRTAEGGTKRVRNDRATLLAETKLTDLQRNFASWVWEDPERSDRLAADYNRRFNSTVLRKNDGSHLTVDGLDTGFITPYGHQWDFVQRVLSADEGSLCPYPVGAGKTATMFMTALKLKQLGLVSKPMVVVPNHLLEQIARDGKKLFPQANILMAGKKDLADARSRMLFAARCATGDWDTIVMTHQSFGRLGVHPVTEATYLEELANDYREALGAIDGDDGNQRRIKEIAKQVDRFDARASDLRSKAVDAGVTYENLGVDFLQVDEAHLFKNLALPATTEGMSLGKPSKRATDLDLKILVTRERTGRDNVVALYSGTFISNSVREMYVFKHYTMPKRLEQLGLGNADAWAANHINFETRPEVGVDGVSFRLKRRPVDYVNADEAVALLNEVAELRPREDFKIERPEREERFVEIEATPNLIQYVEGISARIDDIQDGKVKPWQDNMLNVITDGRKAALDLELVGLAPDGPGKVGAVVRNVLEIHNQTKNLKFPGDAEDVEGALQLLFCDLGTPGKERGSQVYGKIRRGLIAGLPDEGLPGIPRERIKFIHDYNSDLAKEQLFTDSRSGKVNVLFMSSQKGGTGVNVQSRGVALHHVDPPHRPDEWEQREGRLDRPGNKMIKLGKPVTFLRYLALHSFDSYMFQQLERKQRPIVQILSGRKVGRVIEEIDAVGAGFGAAKAMVSGNPLLMELTTVNGQLQTLLNEADGHRQSQGRMQRKVELLDQEITQGERSLAPMQAMADAVTAAADDDTWRTADGRLVQPDDVASALAESAQGAQSTLDLDAGYTWRGLSVGFTWHRKQQFGNLAYESYAHLVVPGEHQVDVRLNLPWFGKGQTWRITKALGEAADAAVSAPDELRVKVVKMRASLEDTLPHLGRPFGKHAELEDIRARRAALEAQIADVAVSSGRESGSGPQFDPGAAGAEMTETDMAMHDAAVMVGMMGGSAVVRSEGQIVGTVRTLRGPAPADEPPRPHLENPDRWDEALKAVTDAGLADTDVIAWAQSNAADNAFVGAFGEWTRAWVEQFANAAQDQPEWVHAYLDDRAYAVRDELHSQAAFAVRQQARAAGAEPAPAPPTSVTTADGPQQAEPAPEMVKVAAILRYYEPLFERHGLTGASAAANYVTRPGYGHDYDPDSPLPDLADRISGAADRARGQFRTGPNSSVTYPLCQNRSSQAYWMIH